MDIIISAVAQMPEIHFQFFIWLAAQSWKYDYFYAFVITMSLLLDMIFKNLKFQIQLSVSLSLYNLLFDVGHRGLPNLHCVK